MRGAPPNKRMLLPNGSRARIVLKHSLQLIRGVRLT
jgi:hypothetical protein